MTLNVTLTGVPDPVAFAATMVAVYVPAAVGMPEMTPVAGSITLPGGRPVAVKFIGLFVAMVPYWNKTPVVASNDDGLVICGSDA